MGAQRVQKCVQRVIVQMQLLQPLRPPEGEQPQNGVHRPARKNQIQQNGHQHALQVEQKRQHHGGIADAVQPLHQKINDMLSQTAAGQRRTQPPGQPHRQHEKQYQIGEQHHRHIQQLGEDHLCPADAPADGYLHGFGLEILREYRQYVKQTQKHGHKRQGKRDGAQIRHRVPVAIDGKPAPHRHQNHSHRHQHDFHQMGSAGHGTAVIRQKILFHCALPPLLPPTRLK